MHLPHLKTVQIIFSLFEPDSPPLVHTVHMDFLLVFPFPNDRSLAEEDIPLYADPPFPISFVSTLPILAHLRHGAMLFLSLVCSYKQNKKVTKNFFSITFHYRSIQLMTDKNRLYRPTNFYHNSYPPLQESSFIFLKFFHHFLWDNKMKCSHGSPCYIPLCKADHYFIFSIDIKLLVFINHLISPFHAFKNRYYPFYRSDTA